MALETNASGGEIRYTLTGDEPAKTSALYTGPQRTFASFFAANTGKAG
ncbi:MAG: FN3 associated domain-containing protein [bacterium]